jgi:hypothetical protein
MDLDEVEDIDEEIFKERLRLRDHAKEQSPIYAGRFREAGLDGVSVIKSVDWQHWITKPTAKVWEAVALHCYINPASTSPSLLQSGGEVKRRTAVWFYRWRLITALQYVESEMMDTLTYEDDLCERQVGFDDYVKWAKYLDYPLPKKFPRQKPIPLIGKGGSLSHRKWPWGSHETDLLRVLAEAGELWRPVDEGGLYDPYDPTTAPTNEQMVLWLKKYGVSGKVSDAIATILRADSFPYGPRTIKS